MPTSVPGSRQAPHARPARGARRGFTLIELMVVLAIIAIGVALVSLAIRDPAATRLDNDAARLAALLEMARTEARAGGLDALWAPATTPRDEPFHFVGLPPGLKMPTRWLDERVSAQIIGGTVVTLGPEAILPAQRIVLRLDDRRVEIASDGLSAFAVVPPQEAQAQ